MATPPPPSPTLNPSNEPAPDQGASKEPVREPVPALSPSNGQVDGLIHVQQLPTTAQLTNDAEAENMTITRMEQSADRIIVTYRYASGNTRTFAYTTVLPVDPDSQTAPPRTVTAPPPERSPRYTVIYTEPEPVYYYPRYTTRYYDPWPTFSLGLGFGRSYGSYGGFGYHHRPHYYGGYRGGHHYGGHHHGGRRR